MIQSSFPRKGERFPMQKSTIPVKWNGNHFSNTHEFNFTGPDITLTEDGDVTNVTVGGNVINVKAYGAMGDGTTDDTQAIQAAIDAITGYWFTLYFPKGIYKVTSRLLYKWKINSRIVFEDAMIEHSGDGFATTPVFEITGCSHARIYGMRIHQKDGDTNMCAAGLVLGRASSGFEGGGDMVFYDMYIDGYYNWGACYMVAAEVCAFFSCWYYNKYSNKACLYYMGFDQGELCELNSTSNTVNAWYNCTFWQLNADQAGNEVPIVVLAAYCSELSFRDSWCYVASGKCIAFELINDAGTGETGDIDASVYYLVIDRWRNESGADGSAIVKVNADCNLSALYLTGVKWPSNDGNILDVSGNIYYSDITPGTIHASVLGNTVYVATVRNGGRLGYSRIFCNGDDADLAYHPIVVEAGGTVYECTIDMKGGDYPFEGAGDYEDDSPGTGYLLENILTYNGGMKISRIKRGAVRWIGNDSTPSVKTGDFFNVNGSYPAWDITMFDDGEEGQIITLHFIGGTNATLKADDSKLVMRGGVDWTPSVNSSITFIYDSYYDLWVELSRTERATTNTVNGDTTPSVKGLDMLVISDAAPNTITDLDDGYSGQQVVCIFATGNTTFDYTAGNFYGASGTVTFSANSSITATYYNGKWYTK